jgi:hypothetical protein
LDAYGLPNDLHAAKEEIHDWRSAFEACGVIGGPDSLRKWGVEKEAHHREHHEREDDCRDLLARALVSLGCTDEHGRHADGDIVSDAECVRQLAEKRAGLSSGPAPSELFPLAVRIEKGRQKYPTGCTLLSLLDEAGEVAHAVNKRESNDRVRDELLDVAAVAMRLYFGEIDTAWQPDFGAAPKGGVSDG